MTDEEFQVILAKMNKKVNKLLKKIKEKDVNFDEDDDV